MILDPSELSTREIYLLMVSAIVPRPIAWVSTRSAAGHDNLAPFSYFNGVSSKPPTLLICVGSRKWNGEIVKKDTWRNIEETGEFVVHASTEAMAEQINASSAELPPDVSEIAELGLTAGPSKVVKPPRILESPVAFECRLDRVIEVGEPALTGLILGEVVRFHVDESVWDEAERAVDPEKLRPVGRLGGRKWARAFAVFEQQRPDW